jgi:hypothetical protein
MMGPRLDHRASGIALDSAASALPGNPGTGHAESFQDSLCEELAKGRILDALKDQAEQLEAKVGVVSLHTLGFGGNLRSSCSASSAVRKS